MLLIAHGKKTEPPCGVRLCIKSGLLPIIEVRCIAILYWEGKVAFFIYAVLIPTSQHHFKWTTIFAVSAQAYGATG